MVLWFTSDTHFNHSNIIQYSERPFSGIGEMTAALVNNWNEIVGKNDIVYHLGDFALSWDKKHAKAIDNTLAALNGQKWLITGNHDRDEVTKNPRWAKVTPYHELKIDLGGVRKQRIVMCHYPFRSWNQMSQGAWMLHGHSHGNLDSIGGKIMDVGVDCHNFRPISIGCIREAMSHKVPYICDHHGRETSDRIPT